MSAQNYVLSLFWGHAAQCDPSLGAVASCGSHIGGHTEGQAR